MGGLKVDSPVMLYSFSKSPEVTLLVSILDGPIWQIEWPTNLLPSFLLSFLSHFMPAIMPVAICCMALSLAVSTHCCMVCSGFLVVPVVPFVVICHRPALRTGISCALALKDSAPMVKTASAAGMAT